MIVLVAPGSLLGNNVGRVPVKKRLRHEVLIVVSKEISDVPVSVIIPLDLLVQSIVLFKHESLRSQLILWLICSTGCSFCLRLICHNERFVGQFALVDQDVRVAHAHDLLVVAEATVVRCLFSSERLSRNL